MTRRTLVDDASRPPARWPGAVQPSPPSACRIRRSSTRCARWPREHLGRKKADINTVDSLFAQGMRESTFSALVIAIQQEFGVVIPDDEIRQAKWNDPMVGAVGAAAGGAGREAHAVAAQ